MFSPEIIAAIKAHALEEFPKESCGFVTETGYHPVENVSTNPENEFEVSATDALTYIDALAFIHSHPVADAFNPVKYKPGFYPFCPSESDMLSQMSAQMTWGIVVTDAENAMEPFFWGEFVLDLPLYGRTFRHGVEDCYTIIQKWYWQNKSIRLIDIPRADGWWTTNQDLYVNNFRRAGFTRLTSGEDLKAGDVGLTQLGGKVVKCLNHAMLYLGDGTAAHHLPGRKSSRDAIGGRLSDVKMWLRHESMMGEEL